MGFLERRKYTHKNVKNSFFIFMQKYLPKQNHVYYDMHNSP